MLDNEIKTLLQKGKDAVQTGGILGASVTSALSAPISDFKETLNSLPQNLPIINSNVLNMAGDRLGESAKTIRSSISIDGGGATLRTSSNAAAESKNLSDISSSPNSAVLGAKNPDTPFEALTSREGWIPNPLSSLSSCTYKLKFFIVDDEPFVISNFKNYDEYTNYVNKVKKQTVLIESGVTGLNISSLEIKSAVAPNGITRSMNSTSVILTVVEPLGSTFMDTIVKAADELSIRNYAKIGYYLEVRFQGYEDDGSFAVNPCSNYPNKGVWLFHLVIVNLDVESNSSGSTYKIEMQPQEEMVQGKDSLHLPETLMPQGSTVGEMLKDLETKINQSVIDQYGYPLKSYELIVQKFDFDGKTYDPNTFKVVAAKPEKTDKRQYSMDLIEGTIKASFQKGTQIHDAIELIYGSSEEAQQLAKAVAKIDVIKPDSNSIIKDSIIFRSELQAENLGYNYASQTYAMKFVFISVPFRTQTPVLTREQVNVASDYKAQAANMMRLRQQGFLVKRYDYLFTGENTEVLNLDIKFNTTWVNIIPRFAGFNNSLPSQVSHDTYKDQQTIFFENQAENRRLTEKLNTFDADTATVKKGSLPGATPEESAAAKEAQARLSTVSLTQINDLRDKQQQLRSNIASNVSTLQVYGENQHIPIKASRPPIRYSEEVEKDERVEKRIFPMPISIAEANADTRFYYSGAFPDSSHRDRAIFGAVMDQMYDSQSMVSISFEIKGDPYWLGAANTERTWRSIISARSNLSMPMSGFSPDTIELPKFASGDCMLLINFKHPLGINDDGSPILKDNEFFTGTYRVIGVIHHFQNGEFKQTLECQRDKLSTIFGAAGYKNEAELEKMRKDAAPVPGRPRGGQ